VVNHRGAAHSIQRLGPATRVHADPGATWSAIEQFFDERLAALESAGITRDRLILDPGLGYFLGDTPEPSLTVLANLGRLKTRYDLPILISPSRKSFLRTLTGTDLADIGPATLAAELHAATQGVGYIRTHDPAALTDALTIFRTCVTHQAAAVWPTRAQSSAETAHRRGLVSEAGSG
jgi:dihydropteroate synthase type 2